MQAARIWRAISSSCCVRSTQGTSSLLICSWNSCVFPIATQSIAQSAQYTTEGYKLNMVCKLISKSAFRDHSGCRTLRLALLQSIFDSESSKQKRKFRQASLASLLPPDDNLLCISIYLSSNHLPQWQSACVAYLRHSGSFWYSQILEPPDKDWVEAYQVYLCKCSMQWYKARQSMPIFSSSSHSVS